MTDGYWLIVVIVAVMLVIRIMLDSLEKKWVRHTPPETAEKINYTFTVKFVERPHTVLHLFEKAPTEETGKEFLNASANTLAYLLREIKKGNKVALMNEHGDIIAEISIPLSEKVLAMAQEKREEMPQELKDILKNLKVTTE